MEKLTVSQSPHFSAGLNTTNIMGDVLIALAPATVMGIAVFGFYSAVVIAVSVITAMLAEWICCKALKKENTVSDLSAAVTGLLLALNLPPRIPLWIAALGSAIAIVVVKQFFGGIGNNFANPAITARIVLIVSFPTVMTTWIEPFAWINGLDTVASATPLSAGEGVYSNLDLLLGFRTGCIGEGFALMLMLGGLYLIIRRVITPTIPIAFILTAAIMGWILGLDPIATILSGGVMLGAIFMATDYTTSPVTFVGKIIFGCGCGLITVLIRCFGNLPEGVSYAILLMNILTPLINRLTMPKPFGWEGK